MKLAFVGAGKMATAIAGGLVRNGVWRAADILAADPQAAARAEFAQAVPGAESAESAAELVAAADVVILAVKPQVAAAVVKPLAPLLAGQLVISICAGLTLARLCDWCGTRRVVRTMPNTPLLVGKGATVFTCAESATAADRETVQTIFGALGLVRELPESNMDAVTALSGSGPAYVFEMIQALANAGAAEGLPSAVALELAVQTVAGAAEMAGRGLGTPDALRDAVTSKGGTTAAGLAVFAQAEFRKLVGNVVHAARERSAELGRQ